MRANPQDSEEIVNQILFGEWAIVLEKDTKWSFIRLVHDHYEGWIDNKQLTFTDENPPKNNSRLKAKMGFAKQGDVELLLSAGSVINSDLEITEHQSFSEVNNLTHIALVFLGTTYLWGGRTSFGLDCSGFTQLVFMLNDQILPRDAYMQAENGTTIHFLQESLPGDLAFFDNPEGKIIHVGMVLEDHKIIHAAGAVRIDTLDHHGIYNKELKRYTHNLRIIKRIHL